MTSVCTCMYNIRRDNLASDGFYGLMIVLLSLLGFISVVWLQDQIRNGGGPQWLERDRMEAHRVERREAEHELNNLQADLDEAEERARARERPPERVAAARQVSLLETKRAACMKQLQEVQKRRFDRKLEDLRLLEMELSYDLGIGRRHYMMVLRQARNKHAANMESWRSAQELQRQLTYRREVGDSTASPPDSYCPPKLGPPPTNWGQAFTREELASMKVGFSMLHMHIQ